jgi:hypothetical protein
LPVRFLPITDEAFQKHLVQQHRISEKQATFEANTLIPHRQREDDILTVSSPFASSPLIGDKQLRRLYASIDGNKTVEDLSYVMRLDLQTMLKLLKTLWLQERIAFYDAEGHPLKEMPSSFSGV